MNCPTCGYDVDPTLGMECPRCGESFTCDAVSCGECGGCTGTLGGLKDHLGNVGSGED